MKRNIFLGIIFFTCSVFGAEVESITATSSQSNFSVKKMVDRSLKTFWVSASPASVDNPQMVEIALKKPIVANELTFEPVLDRTQKRGPKTGKLEAKVNGEWKMIKGHIDFSGYAEHIYFDGMEAEAFRLSFTSGYFNKNVQVREVRFCLTDFTPLKETSGAELFPIGKGFAGTTINTTVFRHNAVVTHKGIQYAAYYDVGGLVVLAKRKLGSADWEIKRTELTGNRIDSHNVISIMVDGDGYLHMSWDHHVDNLRYCRSVAPGSLEMTEVMSMVGTEEDRVTYPEFYRMANGDLIFLYRDGSSGNGNLMMNRYDLKTGKWVRVQSGFIGGEGERNAYWQMCTDIKGTIHISWVWREHGGVESNHDMGYAKSEDGGKTWLKSTGEQYELPITEATAEYSLCIPQKHELINTTGMCADGEGNPYIVTYFRKKGETVPQYFMIHNDGNAWHTQQISNRTTPFSLSGGGGKFLPICRPRIVADVMNGRTRAYLLFRDSERGDRVSLGICDNLSERKWRFEDLTSFSVGSWEANYDTELWKSDKKLGVFVQNCEQPDGGGSNAISFMEPQMAYILEWEPSESIVINGL